MNGMASSENILTRSGSTAAGPVRHNLVLKLRNYVRPYYFFITLSVLASIFVAIATALPALIMKFIIDDVLVNRQIGYLIVISIGLIILFIFKGLFFYSQTYLISLVGQKILYTLRKDIFEHLLELPVAFFETRPTGQIMARITNDVAVLQNTVQASVSFLTDTLTITGLIIWIIYLHWQLALVSFLVIPLIGFAVTKFSARLRKIARQIQSKIGDVTAVLQETLSGIRTVKAFTSEEDEAKRFDKENLENYSINMRHTRITSWIIPTIELLNTAGLVTVLSFGGWLVIKPSPELTAGELISFMAALGMLFTPIKRLTGINTYFQQAFAAVERIFEILDEKSETANDAGKPELVETNGHIEFDRVTYLYDDCGHGVKDISFEVKPGEVVALAGPSGSGKTTLVNLLLRFRDPQKGSIKLDGRPITDFTLRSLRKQIGIVPQDSMLFSTTIEENIRYGKKDASDHEIIEAAKKAHAHEFIMNLPQGYRTPVGEHGVRLSGGQKQRIAIARAILRDPRILILDEATSSLDSESEKLVQEALDTLMQGRTTIVIAHRLTTIKNAKKIIVLEHGKITQAGPHEELIRMDGTYRDLYKTYFETGTRASGGMC